MVNTGESMQVCAAGGLFDDASGDEILFYVLVRGVRGAPTMLPQGKFCNFDVRRWPLLASKASFKHVPHILIVFRFQVYPCVPSSSASSNR